MYTAAHEPKYNENVINSLLNNRFDQIVIEYKDGYYKTYNGFNNAILHSGYKIIQMIYMIRETKFRVTNNDDIITLYLYPNDDHIHPNNKSYDGLYIYEGNTKNSPCHKVKSTEERIHELEQESEEINQKIKELKKNNKSEEPHDYSLDMLNWFTNGALIILLILGIACWYSPGGKILSYIIGIGIAGFGWIRDRLS